MASRGVFLLRLRHTTSIPFTTNAQPPRLPSSANRSLLTPPTRPAPLPSLRRSFSHSLPRADQPDPNRPQGGPPGYDYDPLLGDPWYYHRLRKAKPFFGGRNVRQILSAPLTRKIILASAAAAAVFYWWNIEVVPVSGRRRFNCYSDEKMRQLGAAMYRQQLQECQNATFLPPDDRRVRMVRRVMDRLIPVAAIEGQEAYDWDLHVIDDEDPRHANAFVLPGGKVFVFSAILRFAQTEDQIAAVLSHEIAHSIAKHAGERMSSAMGEIFVIGSALMLVAAMPLVFLTGFFFGGSLMRVLVSRPMSRMQESEADYIGLMIAAEACYDPRQAITFWERIDHLQKQLGVQKSQLLMTHPSSEQRVQNILQWLPEAMQKREQSDCRGTQGFAEMFARAMKKGDILASSAKEF